MKTIRTIGKVLFVAAIFSLGACSEDDNGGGGGGTPGGTFVKAKVNGTWHETYRIQGISAATGISTGTGDGRVIMIGGPVDAAANRSWSVNLLGINAPGTYTIGPDSNSTVAFIENMISYDNSNCDGATGTVTITTITADKVEGTFSLTGKDDDNCTDSRTIAEGSFRGEFTGN